MKTLNIAEARGRFSELVEDVYGGGGPVVVSRYGHPMVMIVPAQVDPPEKPDPFPLRGVPLETSTNRWTRSGTPCRNPLRSVAAPSAGGRDDPA